MAPLDSIIALLRQKIGLDADSIGRSAIEWAVSERLRARALPVLAVYTEMMLKEPVEQKALIEQVVISETWFFREAAAFQMLGKHVRTKWTKALPFSRITLLSLPCASGEEPYSMVMTLLQAGVDPAAIHVDAVDISSQVLQIAQAGVYAQHSFRGVQAEYRDRFFKKRDDGWYEIDEKVRSNVQFTEGNILEPPAWLLTRRYDVIFCRNLLIYLDPDNRRKAIALLQRLLKPNGLIFVGHAEIQEMINRGFERFGENRAFAFQVPVSSETKILRAPAKPVATRNFVAPSAPVAPVKTLPPPPPVLKAQSLSSEIARLANRGAYGEASVLCDRLVRTSPGNAEGYYWLGIVRHAQAQPKQAEEAFRKALYLNPTHYEALVHLALLLDNQGDTQTAERLRRRAERLALAAP